MKKVSVLRNESVRIQSQIRALLIQRYSYENGLTKQLSIIGSVARLQQKLYALRREIVERQTILD
ncbi:MAG TPA: hypothetical protein VL442_09945 [Mucilaginibacter sp.]|nr:hypothetical protein [Mucilaginibacter sp.]